MKMLQRIREKENAMEIKSEVLRKCLDAAHILQKNNFFRAIKIEHI